MRYHNMIVRKKQNLSLSLLQSGNIIRAPTISDLPSTVDASLHERSKYPFPFPPFPHQLLNYTNRSTTRIYYKISVTTTRLRVCMYINIMYNEKLYDHTRHNNVKI